jgi:membrane-associated phospholipid phosphatase
MWGFTMAHEVPYDDPEALRRRLRIRYPIRLDRAIGGGELPNARLQRALADPEEPHALDRFLSLVHWAWFFVPHVTLVYVLLRDDELKPSERRFPRAARQMAATYDLGCTGYFAVPTAPPWWAAENGYAEERVRRLMVDVGERVWGDAWPRLYDSLGGNPWAAMPSLHFGSSLMAAMLLRETGPVAGGLGWAYALTLGFALVYLGEHYVTDLAAGAALAFAVRGGEPIADPVVSRVSAAIQRLERIANG